MRIATPLEDLTEKEWDRMLVGTPGAPGLAIQLGWKAYHTLRSKGSSPGYPDWTLVRERVVFIESKTETGRISSTQAEWLNALMRAEAEVYVARPRDLDLLSVVLQRRGRLAWTIPAASQLATSTLREIEKVLGR